MLNSLDIGRRWNVDKELLRTTEANLKNLQKEIGKQEKAERAQSREKKRGKCVEPGGHNQNSELKSGQ